MERATSGRPMPICIVCLLLILLPAVRTAGAANDESVTPYAYNYIGEVMPAPQEVTYKDSFVPLLDIEGQRPLARIVIRAGASRAEQIGAQELAARVCFLAKDRGNIEITKGPASDQPYLLIGPGLGAAPDLVAPSHPEGYAVRVSANGRRIEAAARDTLGLYWACRSLVQLLTLRNERVVLRKAEIVDFPVFQVRSFKIQGDHASIEEMGRWSASAKFNTYNVCYTTVGADRWPDPAEDYRALVGRLCDFHLPRGMDVMLFVNPYYLWKEHIQTSDPADLDALARTCSLALERGARKVMLCLDDYASEPVRNAPRLYVVRNEQDRKAFGDDLAKANVALLDGWYRRMKDRFPNATLLAVPPYYWIPDGTFREEGIRCLREIGRRTPEDLVIVWTGPWVRSTQVHRASVRRYTDFIGRKPFLWDNSLYAWHSPAHYFLDEFKTRYPEAFWTMNELGCHFNASAGEAHKIGLLCVADYLWNPRAYDPARSLRRAIAIVAGKSSSDALLEFRDLFYEIRDRYPRRIGDPAAIKQGRKDSMGRGLDARARQEVLSTVLRLHELADEIERTCANANLVAEVKERSGVGDPYLELLDKPVNREP